MYKIPGLTQGNMKIISIMGTSTEFSRKGGRNVTCELYVYQAFSQITIIVLSLYLVLLGYNTLLIIRNTRRNSI